MGLCGGLCHPVATYQHQWALHSGFASKRLLVCILLWTTFYFSFVLAICFHASLHCLQCSNDMLTSFLILIHQLSVFASVCHTNVCHWMVVWSNIILHTIVQYRYFSAHFCLYSAVYWIWQRIRTAGREFETVSWIATFSVLHSCVYISHILSLGLRSDCFTLSETIGLKWELLEHLICVDVPYMSLHVLHLP